MCSSDLCGRRRHMGFTSKVECRLVTAIKGWFECCDLGCSDTEMAMSGALEAGEFAQITRGRDDQRAAIDDARIGLAPKSEADVAEFAYDGLGEFGFTVGREHGAGPTARCVRKWRTGGLKNTDAKAGMCQRQRLPEPEDASADDSHVLFASAVSD